MVGQLTSKEIDQLLRSEVIGRIGCHANGRTYVIPVSYVYEDGAVIGHSADGLKLQMMRENPNVCFEVERIEGLSQWRSVVAWGVFEELSGREADRAMAQLLGRLMPLAMSVQWSHAPKVLTQQSRSKTEGLKSVIYCIRLIEKTGRFESREA
jgi:uncharacterized protein